MSGMSDSQRKAGELIKEIVEETGAESALALSRDQLIAVHRTAYPQLADKPDKVVSGYVSHNLRSPIFMASLGLDSQEVRQHVAEELLINLRGENQLFPRDKDLYLTSLKALVRVSHETKARITVEHEFHGRSDEDLQFYIDNDGRWPEETEK